MHRFSRMHLSPELALRHLGAIDLEEKNKLAESVALIAVIDHRRDLLAAGNSCMLDYCKGRLHMSESQSVRRIQAARVALRFPQVFEHLADGRLSVATASVLAPHLAPESATDLLAAAAYRSRDEIMRLLAERSRPRAQASAAPSGTSAVETSSSSPAPGQVNSLEDLCAPSMDAPARGSSAPSRAEEARRGRVSPSEKGGYDVRLSITDDEHDVLRRAQALLGHAVPSGDPALIYARAMQHYLAHLEKRRFDVKPGAALPAGNATSRRIPKPLRRLVWERDGSRCAFVSADGLRCGSTLRLEVDHITPLARGGRTEPEHLRLLCRAHNQYEAERVLGKDHVQTKRELAHRERARAKAAPDAAVERERARDAAKKARNDDLEAALRGLGFTVARAKRGVEMADAMPEASLETCFRHVLTEVTRHVAMRGERRAMCAW